MERSTSSYMCVTFVSESFARKHLRPPGPPTAANTTKLINYTKSHFSVWVYNRMCLPEFGVCSTRVTLRYPAPFASCVVDLHPPWAVGLRVRSNMRVFNMSRVERSLLRPKSFPNGLGRRLTIDTCQGDKSTRSQSNWIIGSPPTSKSQMRGACI
jgi:hypothetical protein